MTYEPDMTSMHRVPAQRAYNAECFDPTKLAAISSKAFSKASPFPWCAQENLIRESMYSRLLADLPPLDLFERVVGKRRRYGQRSHDRYALDYSPELTLAPSWQRFIEELYSGPYVEKIAELLGRRDFFLTSHWHYASTGCSVSPHCDADWKLGSHVFYFNREDEWDASWGGATVVLDDGGRFDYRSAPGFEDFVSRLDYPPVGNRSFLFQRTAHSWHGVEPLRCPEGRMRKVFIVEFREDSLRERFRARTGI